MSFRERYLKGKEFQEYVKDLFALSGYFEGQIYSTGVSVETNHYEKLRKSGKHSYTSPDIFIANKWIEKTPVVEFRFGVACGRRDKIFNSYGMPSVTIPTYQRKQYEEISRMKKLEIYFAFGKKIGSMFAIGITPLREPDSIIYLKDASTGNRRALDIYYIENLWSWKRFIEHRIEKGDEEPSYENLEKLKVPWLGDYPIYL